MAPTIEEGRPPAKSLSFLLLLNSLIITAIIISGHLIESTTSTSFLQTVIPSKKCRTFDQLRIYPLRFETSPLIGGPSWLPLHIKVLFESKDLISPDRATIFSLYHQWDLIPINPTTTSTIKKLTSLQYVPAQIRYRVYTNLQSNNEKTSSQELLSTIVYDAETLDGMSENIITLIGDRIESMETTSLLCQENILMDSRYHEDQRLMRKAHEFCQLYMLRNNMQIHLIMNNCWTFAFQLMYHLHMSDLQIIGDNRVTVSKPARNLNED
jgi:hypothetical protein